MPSHPDNCWRPFASRRGGRELIATATILITCGLVTATGLPANASAFETPVVEAVAAPVTVETQSIVVDTGAAKSDVVRDAFEATTSSELEEIRAEAQRALVAAQRAILFANSASGSRVAVQPGDNDYPWIDAPTGGSFSPLRYVYRQCVDFVAWRLNRDAGTPQAPFKYDWSDLTPGGGDGRQWLPAWKAHGWPVSDVPIAGAVAYTGGNHVAYVKEVLGDGRVVLEEYNYVPHEYSSRIVAASSVAAFLYPPPR